MTTTKRVDLAKRNGQWIAHTRDGAEYAKGRTKADAVTKTAKVARKDPEAVSLKIHGQDGKIQQERTYPRSEDPRSSRG